ncbi:MAG: nitroreductase family protein [Gammaproteobacteria bacterium]|jgi:nitroreductase|nr:nitroreductase family protein [Gammaproteobacteria bacterium]
MINKAIDVSAPVHELISSRWSGVSYDPAKMVDDADLRAMAEAARWAPSCFGDQPWRVIFCSKSSDSEAWQQAYSCLAEGNQPWCQHAPVLAIICADTLFSQTDEENAWGAYDTGAAAISICLQASSLGLMTHQMAGFSPDLARETFTIPARYQPMAMMTIGYQCAEADIPEALRGRELAPRKRNPLAEHFFLSGWGKGI